MIIVVFAGLLLGGVLAHFFGSRESVAQQAMNPPPVTPIASPTPMPAVTQRPRPARTATPEATRSPRTKPKRGSRTPATPSVQPSSSAQPTPSVVALQMQTPQSLFTARPIVLPTATARSATAVLAAPVPHGLPPVVTEPPRTPPPAPAPPTPRPRQPVSGIVALHLPSTPDAVVRAYLSELARGHSDAAAAYLASGSPTEESFMRGAQITDIRTVNNGDGTYNVTADVITRDGRYRIVATVAALPYGMLITDHFSMKPR